MKYITRSRNRNLGRSHINTQGTVPERRSRRCIQSDSESEDKLAYDAEILSDSDEEIETTEEEEDVTDIDEESEEIQGSYTHLELCRILKAHSVRWFSAIPSIGYLSFEEWIGPQDHLSHQPSCSKRLYIGVIDSPFRAQQENVYIYLHSRGNCRFGLVWGTNNEELLMKKLNRVVLVKPFRNLCYFGRAIREAEIARVKAVTCFYYLAAGHIETVRRYSSFDICLVEACQWIYESRKFEPNFQLPWLVNKDNLKETQVMHDEASPKKIVILKVRNLPSSQILAPPAANKEESVVELGIYRPAKTPVPDSSGRSNAIAFGSQSARRDAAAHMLGIEECHKQISAHIQALQTSYNTVSQNIQNSERQETMINHQSSEIEKLKCKLGQEYSKSTDLKNDNEALELRVVKLKNLLKRTRDSESAKSMQLNSQQKTLEDSEKKRVKAEKALHDFRDAQEEKMRAVYKALQK